MGRPKRTIIRILGLAIGLALFVAAAIGVVKWLGKTPSFEVDPTSGSGSSRRTESNPAGEDPKPSIAPEITAVEREPGPGWSRLFGKVVADADGSPIEGARIGVPRFLGLAWEADGVVDFGAEASAELARSDAEGAFEISPDARGLVLRAAAEGFGVAMLEREWLGTTREDPFVVRLDASATLKGRVVDEDDSAVAGARIRIWSSGTYFGMRPVRKPLDHLRGLIAITEKVSDADGYVTFDALPGLVLFDIGIEKSEASKWRDPQSLYPEPGKTVIRQWRIPAGASVTGHAIDEDGREVRGVELSLVEAPGSTPPKQATDLRPDDSAERPPVRTDDLGRFRIEDVTAGPWVVLAKMTFTTVERDGFLPSVARFEIGPRDRTHELMVTIRRGRSIRGKVLDPQGRGADANVRVTSLETGLLPFLPGGTDREGRFAVGPFDGENYELFAEPRDSTYVASESVTVSAGKDDVVLRLRPGMLLQAHATREEDDARVAARFVLFPQGDPETPIGDGDAWRSKDGSFRGIRPGRYDIVATTGDDRIGIERELQVREGTQLPEVRVKLVRGARLVLRLAGAPREEAMVELHTAGTRIAIEKVATDAATTVVVPAGTTTIVWRGHTTHRDTVELRAGETRELVWPRPP